MKVYLQNVQAGTYFQRQGKWTSNRENALNFQNVLDALDLSQNLHQIDLEVVLAFDDGQADARLSMGCMVSTSCGPIPGIVTFA